MKKELILIMICICLLTSGCINQNPPKDFTNAKTLFKGYGGLKASFVKNAPPTKVFEEEYFSAILKIENKGAYDVGFNEQGEEDTSKRGTLVIIPESSYVDISSEQCKDCGIKKDEFVNPKVGFPNTGYFQVRGKSLTDPIGDNINVYSTLKSRELLSLSNIHESSIFATLCYPYQTEVSASVCIDPDIYNLKPTEKACESKSLVFSGGQGAPVAITKIDVKISPGEKEELHPVFIIYIENKGQGEVVNIEKVKNVCDGFIDQSEEGNKYFNQINIKEAKLSTNDLDCSQGKSKDTLFLTGKKGVIQCRVKDSEPISPDQPSYSTPLSLTLEYGYTSTISKRFNIEKTLGK